MLNSIPGTSLFRSLPTAADHKGMSAVIAKNLPTH